MMEPAVVYLEFTAPTATWEMKEDALEKGLSAPDEAAIQERVLRKDVEAPNLAT